MQQIPSALPATPQAHLAPVLTLTPAGAPSPVAPNDTRHVAKVSETRELYSGAQQLDLLGKAIGDGIKGGQIYGNNFAAFHGPNGEDAYALYPVDGMFSDVFVPDELQHSPLSSAEQHALNDHSGLWYGNGNSAIKTAFYIAANRFPRASAWNSASPLESQSYTLWSTGNHTHIPVNVFAWGPRSIAKKVHGLIDNTDLFWIMKQGLESPDSRE